MAPNLHKFPRTPHLYWLGSTPARGDKVLTPHDAAAFLDGEIVVEEKVDGANLGISMTAAGMARFQNRGNFLEGKFTGQFTPLRGWAARYLDSWRQHLPADAVLFGEWCRVRHGIHYTSLPEWFLGFDLLETCTGRFWDTRRRHALLTTLRLPPIRFVARGCFNRNEILSFLQEKSAYVDAPLEGVYLRREAGGFLTARAKLVRTEFTRGIEKHWSRGPLRENGLTRQAALCC